MTTVFQQAIQLIALALGFGFLKEFAAIAAFEPVQDLIWKLLMSLAFVYMATRVPSMLGNARHLRLLALDALLRHEPALVADALGPKTIGLMSGRRGGRAGGHGGGSDGGQRGRFGRRQRPQLGGFVGDPIGWRGTTAAKPPGAAASNDNDRPHRRERQSSRPTTTQRREERCAVD